MILAVDVHYAGEGGTVAGVGFGDWDAAEPALAVRSHVERVAPYAQGAFYERELPCILQLLREHGLQPSCIVVDGYVYLDGHQRPGLGRHLFDALGGRVPVVGVAKTAFAGIGEACEVLRGDSKRPLYVTCAGLSLEEAKAGVARMHGSHRIPTLLRAVDRLCRDAAAEAHEETPGRSQVS